MLDALGDGARAELARELKVSPVTVNRWVNRGVQPQRHFRKAILRWLRKQDGLADLKEVDLWPR
jgi:hypothetical protein